MGLVVQVAGAIQHAAVDGRVDVPALREQFGILGNAAGDGVHFDQFFPALVREELVVVGKGDLLQANLSRSSAVQRAAIGQGLGLHRWPGKTGPFYP